MKTTLLKRTVGFILTLVLILSSFCVPSFVGGAAGTTVTASAASAALSKVTGLKASADVTTASLSWKKVSGASGYNLCRYDTAKKKYVSVKNVTEPKVTVKGMKPATSYRLAVRAYKKSGKTVSYGPLSAPVTVVTRPSQVTGLKAARTENSIQLTWNAQKGISGYVVYRYDAAKKKYITAAKTKEDTVTVSGLKAGTTYYFAVKSYVTVNKETYSSSLSDKIKVETLKTGYKISKYQKIQDTGTYTVEGTMSDAGSTESMPVTIACRNGDYMMKSKAEGITMRIIHFGKSGNDYIVIDQLAKYIKANGTEFEEIIDEMDLSQGLLDSVYGSIKTGTKTISGKKYAYESFKTLDGLTVCCYFSGSTLARIENYENGKLTGTIIVKKFTASADDSLFKIPSYYTKLSLSWLS